MARILLGVTGGIAAYKACTLVRLLVRAGHDVHPVLTAGAERFVAAETFAALARRPPSDDPVSASGAVRPARRRPAHGQHARATGPWSRGRRPHRGRTRALGPGARGSGDEHAHVAAPGDAGERRDVALAGVQIVGPSEGELAEGEEGVGRMAEPEEIQRRIEQLLRPAGLLAGRRVVVSAGGTREPLDAVRYVGNRSSGRMGVALAEEADRRGADVTLLAANVAVPAPAGISLVETPTAADLEREALERADADVIVMAAAVADYRPQAPLQDKRLKDGAEWTVALEPTADVLAAIGSRRRAGQVLVGFAADHGEPGLERARAKRLAKNADLFVFNDVSRSDIGFDTPDNEVVVVSERGERTIEKAPKIVVAAAVLDEVERLLSER